MKLLSDIMKHIPNAKFALLAALSVLLVTVVGSLVIGRIYSSTISKSAVSSAAQWHLIKCKTGSH